jgi:hypothetical protein
MTRSGFGNRRQQGVAMVEFAIALPLLLLLLLGIAEFGRLLVQYNSLLQASRDAGRYVAGKVWNRTLGEMTLSDQLLTETRHVAVYGLPRNTGAPVVPGLSLADVQVSPVAGTTDHVQVRIGYTFRPVIGSALPALFTGQGLSLEVPLAATVVMRAL